MTHSSHLDNDAKEHIADLILRNIQNDEDKKRFAAFNATYNNPSEGATCTCLLDHHPEMKNSDCWLVEDKDTGEIVSTTCLIPWEGQLCGVQVRIAQLEMVLTHPGYRRQGLVRTQIENFLQEVKSRGYDMSIIWGIPYFYRQFGFSYAIEGNTFEALQTESSAASKFSAGTIQEQPGSGINLRRDAAYCVSTNPATVQDIPLLVSFYGRMVEGLGFSIQRTPDYWQYLLLHAHHPVEMITENHTGQTIGYVILKNPDKTENETPILVLENFLPDTQAATAFLCHLQERFPSGSAPGFVHIAWPQTTPLVQAARNLGSVRNLNGQWLLHITDIKRFLEKIAPIFEKRLDESAWKDPSSECVINLYRQAYRLRFTEGRLQTVDALGFVDASMGADGGDLCIPPDAFVRLLTGFRGLDELYDAWPDINIKSTQRPLIDILFPRFPAYLSTPFHFMGT